MTTWMTLPNRGTKILQRDTTTSSSKNIASRTWLILTRTRSDCDGEQRLKLRKVKASLNVEANIVILRRSLLVGRLVYLLIIIIFLSLQVNFSYIEHGEQKNALVKLRLCKGCSLKLNFHSTKRKIKKEAKNKSSKKHKKHKKKHRRHSSSSSSDSESDTEQPTTSKLKEEPLVEDEKTEASF